jgi:nitrous oxide reductase
MKIIDTTFENDGQYYTGKIAGENCYGKEKAKQMLPILAASRGVPSYGYGHGRGDAHFIAEVKYGFNMPLNASNVTSEWFAAHKERLVLNFIFCTYISYQKFTYAEE